MDANCFVFAWVGEEQDSVSFEENVPLQTLGRQLRQLGSKGVFNILFLDGYDRLSGRYISKLEDLGFNLTDLGSEYRELSRSFRSLEQFGRFEMSCFLRWPLLASYLSSENITGQIFHIDGDVLFNASPEQIAEDLKGLTIVLQGCPAFVSITNYDWFQCYHEELVKFSQDIEGYSSRAWDERSGWEQSDKERWAGQRYRRVISSDQDLISHLIHTGRIIQDDPAQFADQLCLYYTENPLYFNSHASIQLSSDTGLCFSSDEGSCSVNGKMIAFWHFQGSFAAYVNAAIVLHKLHYPFRTPNHLSGRFRKLLSRGARSVCQMGRKRVYGCIRELNLEEGNTGFSFVDIFNGRSYWKKGVFSNLPPARSMPNRRSHPTKVA